MLRLTVAGRLALMASYFPIMGSFLLLEPKTIHGLHYTLGENRFKKISLPNFLRIFYAKKNNIHFLGILGKLELFSFRTNLNIV